MKFHPIHSVNSSSGFTITCIDCSIEGKFQLNTDFSIDEDIVSQISALASSEVAVASTVSSEVTSVATVAASVFTSVNSQVVTGATSIEGQASSIVDSIEASATPFVQSVASDVGGVFTSLFPLMQRSKRKPFVRRQSPQPLAILNNFTMSLTQMVPIKASFNLEFVTSNESIKLPLGASAPLPGILPVTPPEVQLGPVNFGLAIQPVGLAFSATLQPNMNVTLPFGANITFQRPLFISQAGIEDVDPSVTLLSSPPVLNQFDPSLCLSAALGPFFKLFFEIPDADVKINLNTQLDLPKVNLCFSELSGKVPCFLCQPFTDICRCQHSMSTKRDYQKRS